MNDAVVKIHSSVNANFGTGFVFKNTESSSFILTCGHVIKSIETSLLANEKPAEIIYSAYESGLDLAVLKADKINCTPLTLSDSSDLKSLTVTGYTSLLKGVKKESITINDAKK